MPKEFANVIGSIKVLQSQMVYHRVGCGSFEFLSQVFLHSACEENSEGKLTVASICIGNDLNELCHQFFIVTLIEGINKYDHGCYCGIGVCHHKNGFNHQFLELIVKCLSDNQWVHMKHVLNEWFGSGNRN
jgi:hypothetical protein